MLGGEFVFESLCAAFRALGVDSSYHVRTNVSVRRGMFEALAYILYVREEVFISSSVYLNGY